MEGIAEDYEKLIPEYCIEYVESCLNSYLPKMSWSENDVILDVGCGPGKRTKNILLTKCPKFKKIIAIDIDRDNIDYARKNYFHEKIEYKTQDIIEKFEDAEKYDKIVSFYVFHLITDFNKLFASISSIIKPEGYFLFIIISKCPLLSIIRDLSKCEEWKKHVKIDVLANVPPTVYWKDAETELQLLLSKFGLHVKQSKRDIVNVPFLDKRHFTDFYMTVFPKRILQNVDSEVKHYLWKKAEPVFFKNAVTEKNKVLGSYELLQVFGQKKIL